MELEAEIDMVKYLGGGFRVSVWDCAAKLYKHILFTSHLLRMYNIILYIMHTISSTYHTHNIIETVVRMHVHVLNIEFEYR